MTDEEAASWETEKANIFQDLDIAEAEVERLLAALREIKALPIIERTDFRVMEIIDAALSGKEET